MGSPSERRPRPAPLRIAVVVTAYPSASETFVADQVRGLISRGHDVTVLAVASPSVLDAAAKAIGAALGGPRTFARIRRRARADADPLTIPLVMLARGGKKRFDAIVAHFGPNGRAAVAARDLGLLSGPIATVFHGYDLTRHVRDKPPNYYADLFERGDLFLPVSDHFAERLAMLGANTNRIRVHRIGVDVAARRFSVRERAPDEPLRVISVARLVEKKGIDHGIEAIARLRRRRHAVRYEVLGDGPLRTDLEARARALGLGADAVRFRGWSSREDVEAAMTRADVLLVPSVTASDGDQEGLPVVIMEAMAGGLPVVASRHSGIPELVRDTETGLIVPERDVEGLARALERLQDDPRLSARLARAARAIIERDYARDVLDARLEVMLRDLAASRGATP